MLIDYHRSARKELFDSSERYSTLVPGLGEEFLNEVGQAANVIAAAPERFPIYQDDVRRYVMRRFPYVILYRRFETKIRILALSHTSRLPGYWQHRR
jgi:hypothetical protein